MIGTSLKNISMLTKSIILQYFQHFFALPNKDLSQVIMLIAIIKRKDKATSIKSFDNNNKEKLKPIEKKRNQKDSKKDSSTTTSSSRNNFYYDHC